MGACGSNAAVDVPSGVVRSLTGPAAAGPTDITRKYMLLSSSRMAHIRMAHVDAGDGGADAELALFHSSCSNMQPTPSEKCKLVVVNDTTAQELGPLYLCYVDDAGHLHHHQPVHQKSFINDGSVTNQVTHYTQAGHAFVFYVLRSSLAFSAQSFRLITDITAEHFVCAYKILLATDDAAVDMAAVGDTVQMPEHILTISHTASAGAGASALHLPLSRIICQVRHITHDAPTATAAAATVGAVGGGSGSGDSAVVDNTHVQYTCTNIAGFSVWHEQCEQKHSQHLQQQQRHSLVSSGGHDLFVEIIQDVDDEDSDGPSAAPAVLAEQAGKEEYEDSDGLAAAVLGREGGTDSDTMVTWSETDCQGQDRDSDSDWDRDKEGMHTSVSSALTALTLDLQQVGRLLPAPALRALQKSTPIYVNFKRFYGPVSQPEQGNMCYHPQGSKSWLLDKGLPTSHELCIEIFDAHDYMLSRQLWGTGGLVLHELCHAYHDKHVCDGYNNRVIQAAYSEAMRGKLYDQVMVKCHRSAPTPTPGPADAPAPASASSSSSSSSAAAAAAAAAASAPPLVLARRGPTRAYACTDCMEFFAELSTAFMCDVPEPVTEEAKEGEEERRGKQVWEYNKWEPFNRPQLQQLDHGTCDVLQQVWDALPTPFATEAVVGSDAGAGAGADAGVAVGHIGTNGDADGNVNVSAASISLSLDDGGSSDGDIFYAATRESTDLNLSTVSTSSAGDGGGGGWCDGEGGGKGKEAGKRRRQRQKYGKRKKEKKER